MFGPRIAFPGLWPHRPRPLPDELLSSFLIRAGHGLGLKPISFLTCVFGSSRSLLNQDLDAYCGPAFTATLARGSGLSEAKVSAMTLAATLGDLNASKTPKARKVWLLPTTIATNTRKRPGLQYCPVCLHGDEKTYFRQRWRLAFATTCTTHGVHMRDRCPSCQGIVHPHRAPAMRICYRCGEDLAKSRFSAPADPDILAFQSGLEAALRDGWIPIGGRPVPAPMWFMVVRRICAMVVNKRTAQPLLNVVSANLGGADDPIKKAHPRDIFEYLSVADRRRALEVAQRILSDYPHSMTNVLRSAGLARSHVIKDMAYVPFVLDDVLKEHLDDTPYHASELEVMAAAAYLRRQHGLATYRALKAHCGESRAAIYRHMDYERQQSEPSWWRQTALVTRDPQSIPTRELQRLVKERLPRRDA